SWTARSTNCNLVLTDVQGRITSPCYPQKYPNSQTCKWIIQAPAGFIIQLSFLDFDLEEAPGCIYDRVVVNTGNADVKFCGLTANGLTLNSTGNVMELSFTSDFSVQKKGFSVSFRHVAVALRNQKVKITSGNTQVTKVANSVSIPALNQLTVCFEVERTNQKQKETFFTYLEMSGAERLSVGSTPAGMAMNINGVTCPINSMVSSADFTSSMKRLCLLWTSSNGQVVVYVNGQYKTQICSLTIGHSVPAGGQFRLGGKSLNNFPGNMYNLRLWDYAMTEHQLQALTCDTVGNVIDWDNSHWTIPSSLMNQTVQNWVHTVYVHNIRWQNHTKELFLCVYFFVVSSLSHLSLLSCPLLTENCPKEDLLHYPWPETRPTVTQYLPCFPYKDKSVSRTCLISPQNYSSYWSRPDNDSCKSIDDIKVSAGESIRQSVVTKVQELVTVAKINSSLAKTVVTIISNVMTSSETALVTSSEKALKAVDELVQKIEFDGPSLKITSRNLALGIMANNATAFSGMSFSAFIPPNTTDPQVTVLLLSGRRRQIVLSRINFMFFSSHQPGGRSLNSYVVASSVGNFSISGLTEPVKIEIAHLSEQPSLNPVCVFWDFSMDSKSVTTSASTVPGSANVHTFALTSTPKNNRILTFITYVGCGISAIFSLSGCLELFSNDRKLRRDYPSKILMNLSASLLFLNMVFLLDGWLASLETNWLCLSVAFPALLPSIHMYNRPGQGSSTPTYADDILKFCIVGWGLPGVLVGIVVAVDKNSYGCRSTAETDHCWIKSPVVFYTICVGYLCLVFLLNVAMFIVVMMQICGRNSKRTNRSLREEVLRNLRSVVSLTFLLGMTWGFALFAWGPVALAFIYLFTIFNSLQGLFIFIFHCALKENVQKQWRRYLCCGRFKLSDNSDWSKTATNNTKKVSSDNLGKSLSSSSFGSSTANWTSKAKATLNPFTKRLQNILCRLHRFYC
uniref:Adhesion G protein-coupled receptor G6 n=1 Tax=Echeneis naucrates TaxID=173247 RepID=A0A665VSU9_ECHNA